MATEPRRRRRSQNPAPQPVANTESIGVLGLELRDKPASKKVIYSWALWDWATQPFNTVLLTFVFVSLYLTSDAFLSPELQAIAATNPTDPAVEAGKAQLASWFGWGDTIAALLILVIAPVLGARADARGKQKVWLGIATGAMIVGQFALWFVKPEAALFWLGVALIVAIKVFAEIGAVSSNAMLIGIASPSSVGRISALGWGFGYIGGIVAMLLIVVWQTFDWFGVPGDDGLIYRLIAVGCAIWTILFSWPIFKNVPEPSDGDPSRQVGFFASYKLLWNDIKALYRNEKTRPAFWFLLASAVFRDGLGGIFAFGAILGAQVFGFDTQTMLMFGIAANLVAGVSTVLSGRLDDAWGPKRLIEVSLISMIVVGIAVYFLRDLGSIVFWIGGLILCGFVGPAQAASRSFLARLTPAGQEGTIFGLYATTGRATSWMASAAWATLVGITHSTATGILAIVAVLVLGLLLLLPVKAPRHAIEQ